jgi:tagatose 1,6-diphosphate aldolase GatY/KbaY
MKLQPADALLRAAAKGGYAVGAFNCTSTLQVKAVVDTANRLNAPVIVQTSVTPALFYGPAFWVAVTQALAEPLQIPVVLHLDHCDDETLCRDAADAGYTNIMIDASALPYEENIATVKRVVDYCNGLGGVSVEGELGTVGGVEDQVVVAEDEAQLADPLQAIEFVERTGVPIFAPAIGTAHGIYQTANPVIDIDRFAEIHHRLNSEEVIAPLVVHGGTGLQESVVSKLIAAGGAKYNVSTDLKYSLIDTSANFLNQHKDQYNPGKLDQAIYQSTCERICYWIKLLGSEGKANSSLHEMQGKPNE